MKLSRRVAWLLLLLGLSLLLGILFHGFIYDNVVVPLAVVLLLAWRLVLSVHQAAYWGVLILAAAGLALCRVAQTLSASPESPPPAPDRVLKDISDWRLSIQLSSGPGPAVASLKRELARMLVAMYGAQQPEVASYRLHEALRLRQMPLPDSLHAFLFAASGAKSSWIQQLKNLAARPRAWVRRWTGREQAEYFRAIEDTLTFMEALMEIKHGDDYFDSPHH